MRSNLSASRAQPPIRVIAVLLAAAGIAPGGLQMAVRGAGRSRPPRTPAGSPARGCAAARRRREAAAVGAAVDEAVAAADASDARPVVADVEQARRRHRRRRMNSRRVRRPCAHPPATMGGGGRGGSCTGPGGPAEAGSPIGGFTPSGYLRRRRLSGGGAGGAGGSGAGTPAPSGKGSVIDASSVHSGKSCRKRCPRAARRHPASRAAASLLTRERPARRGPGNDGTTVALPKPSTPSRRQAARPKPRSNRDTTHELPRSAHDPETAAHSHAPAATRGAPAPALLARLRPGSPRCHGPKSLPGGRGARRTKTRRPGPPATASRST